MTWHSPVIGARRGRAHGGVTVLRYEPKQAAVCYQTYFLPVLLGEVTAVGVEVPEEHHVLTVNTGDTHDQVQVVNDSEYLKVF